MQQEYIGRADYHELAGDGVYRIHSETEEG